jgi:hypothetical protein
MDTNHDIDELDQVVYDTVHNFKDKASGGKGAAGLARAIGMQGSTLQNKADRKQEFAQLGLKEARSIMLVSGDTTILSTLCQQLGFAAVPLPHIDAPADTDLLDVWADWSEEFGETAASIKKALEDQKITMSEVANVRRELIEDFEKGLAIIDVLKGMAEPEDNVTQLSKVKK